MTKERDDALSRWSRLKQRERRARDKVGAAPGPIAPAPSEGGDMVPGPDRDQAAIVEQLPDIETLEEGSDFTVFLQEGVPEALRRRALRKLWRLNPVFANLDGLNDYDEDFTIVTTLAENLRTIYQVGKGMPNPEPAETQDDDEVPPSEEGESAAAAQASDEGVPDAKRPEISNKNEALASSESPPAAGPVERAVEPESAKISGGRKNAESFAARRRWAGFTS